MNPSGAIRIIHLRSGPGGDEHAPGWQRSDWLFTFDAWEHDSPRTQVRPAALALIELGQASLAEARPALGLAIRLRQQHPAIAVLVHWPAATTEGVVAAMRARVDELIQGDPTPRILLRHLSRMHLRRPQRRRLLERLAAGIEAFHPSLIPDSLLASAHGAATGDEALTKLHGRLLQASRHIAETRRIQSERENRLAYEHRRLREAELHLDERIASLLRAEQSLIQREQAVAQANARLAADLERLKQAEETLQLAADCHEELDHRENALAALERELLSITPLKRAG